MSELKKSLEYYMGLDYEVTFSRDEAGYWIADIYDLPGCGSFGETQEEAYEEAQDAKRSWISTQLEDGCEVPLPHQLEPGLRSITVRARPELHERLKAMADRASMSLSAYMIQCALRRSTIEEVVVTIEQLINKAAVAESRVAVLEKERANVTASASGEFHSKITSYEPSEQDSWYSKESLAGVRGL